MRFAGRTIVIIALGTAIAGGIFVGLKNARAGGFESAAVIRGLLDPDKWFNSFKKNITLKIPENKDLEIPLPSPQAALQEAAPKLQEINQEIKEEVGIDFAKFFGWSAKVFRAFFGAVVGALEAISKTLEK